MVTRRSLVPLTLALLAACSDNTGPQTPTGGATPHLLRWAGGSAPSFSWSGGPETGLGGSAGVGVFRSSSGLSLDGNQAQFWAVRGEERSVQINYVGATGETGAPFLHLSVTDPVYVPGRGDLAPGDSVLITVTVDPENVKVSLEPTGLRFGEAATLLIGYEGADGDLNGDGVVDASDAAIESQLLGMWCREAAGDPWVAIAAVHSLTQRSFTSALAHFSDYAVSW